LLVEPAGGRTAILGPGRAVSAPRHVRRDGNDCRDRQCAAQAACDAPGRGGRSGRPSEFAVAPAGESVVLSFHSDAIHPASPPRSW